MSTRVVAGLAAVAVVAAGLVGEVSAHAGDAGTQAARSIGQDRWTHVNAAEPDRSYWDSDRADGARVGVSTSPPGVFRSFFQFDTTAIEGAKVHRAQFVLTPNHRNSCAPVTLEAWHTRPIDPAVPLTWHNSREHWLGGAPVATQVWPRRATHTGACAPGERHRGTLGR